MESGNDQSNPIYFNSEYRQRVDDKRRVQVPAKWRPEDSENVEYTLVVWPRGAANDISILGLPTQQWKRLVDRLDAMPFGDGKAISLRRFIGRNSEQVFLDKGGRICLPDKMAQLAGIDKEAVLVGLVDKFEIWNPTRYEATTKADDALSSEAFNMI